MDKRYIEQFYLRKRRSAAFEISKNTTPGLLSGLGKMLRILEEPCCDNEQLIPYAPQGREPNELCMSCGLYRFAVKRKKL
jgi:hypothetical protein